jgi:hypothetical protein
MENKYLIRAAMVVALWLISALPAHAYPIKFDNITNNSSVDAGIGETQLSVDVVDNSDGTVSFTFKNVGPDACSLTDVYFDDQHNKLGGISEISTSGGGVNFSQDATPGNLPGGNDVSFVTTSGLSADSDPPITENGVNNDAEWLTITFSGLDSAAVAAIIAALKSGDLRIGVHVQGFADDGSESFVSSTTHVPIPGAVWLLGSGILGLAGIRIRSRKRKAQS